MSAQAVAVGTLSFLLASNLEGFLPKLWRAPSINPPCQQPPRWSNVVPKVHLCSSVGGGGDRRSQCSDVISISAKLAKEHDTHTNDFEFFLHLKINAFGLNIRWRKAFSLWGH